MEQFGIRERALAVVLIAGLAGSVPASAQTESVSSLPGRATIIVPEDYPAFDHESATEMARQRDVRAVELRAIVLRTEPWSEQNGAIILNPRYANAQTLYLALDVLRKGGGEGLVALSVEGRRRQPGLEPTVTVAVNGILADLRTKPIELIMEVGGSGRRVVIDDVGSLMQRLTPERR